MTYANDIPGGGSFINWEAIHKSSSQVASDAYQNEYGIHCQDDSLWEIGNERHAFWINAFDERQKELIINPHQS